MKFKIIWKDGREENIEGDSVFEAFNNAGYSNEIEDKLRRVIPLCSCGGEPIVIGYGICQQCINDLRRDSTNLVNRSTRHDEEVIRGIN